MGADGHDLPAISLDTRLRLSARVAHREFPEELVVVNLQTGQYHGLNHTAGRMLEALEQRPSIRDAARAVADEFDEPLERVETDMLALCSQLLERGIVEVETGRNAGST